MKDKSWNNQQYVKATKYIGTDANGKRIQQQIYLHHIITDTVGKKVIIDHIDHNGLNNRKNNLRIVTMQENLLNREKANSNNSTGIRNVSWSNYLNKYMVQFVRNGKNKCFGTFKSDELEKAIQLAEELREKFYRIE